MSNEPKAAIAKAVVVDDAEEAARKEARRDCLDECLEQLPEEQRTLILEFYRDEKRTKIDHRDEMAKRLGISRTALGNRAQRIRDKLELCISNCLKKKLAT